MDAGGVERGTLEVARELARRGHRAVVVSGGGRLVPALEAAGVEHINLPIGRKSLLTLRQVGALRRVARQCRADVLHARSRLPAWITYLAWRGMEPGNRPHFVTTVHGPYTVNSYSRIMTRGERVIAISEFIRDYVLANYPEVAPQRIRVIHRGVSAAEFPYGHRPDEAWMRRWEVEFPNLRDRTLLTLPARITRWKGQEDFLELLGTLVERGRPVHGLVVGGTDPRRAPFLRELRQAVAKRRLEARVTFTGHRDDVREIMAVSHIVLSLAREPEAFGRTALEALSLGVPVIAYDHGGAGEVLRRMFPEGLVPAGDLRAAVSRIEAFCDLGPTVPSGVAFTLEQMLDETVNLYAELCAVGHCE